jgi:hypothetical protein
MSLDILSQPVEKLLPVLQILQEYHCTFSSILATLNSALASKEATVANVEA